MLLFSHSVLSHSTNPWTVAYQGSLSFTTSQSLPKFMSIGSVKPSSHLILWWTLLLLPSVLPSIRDLFPMSWLFASGDQNTGASASASVPPMSIQGLFPFKIGWFDLLAVQGALKVSSNTTVQKHQFSGVLPSLQPIRDYWEDHSLDYTDLC